MVQKREPVNTPMHIQFKINKVAKIDYTMGRENFP